MATKTYYLADVAVNGFGTLTETDPGAATTNTGWVVGKTASGNFSKLLYGTERAASTFSTSNGLTTPAAPTGGDSWRSSNTVNGVFANANWTLTFAVRAITSAGTQRGRINLRIWKGANATGAGATQLTSAIQTGGIIAGISTTVDNTTSVTWSPGGTVALTNEYLFVQCQWECTTAGGVTGCDIDFRTTATVTTSDFTANVDGNASGVTLTATSSLSTSGAAAGNAGANGVTQTGTASLIDGTVSAAGSASGALTSAAASTVDGSASGGGNADGVVLSTSSGVIDGGTSADAEIIGDTLTASPAVLDAAATGGAETSGGLADLAASLIEGTASAIAPAAGITSLLAFWLGGGNSLTGAQAFGELLAASTDLISGTASGTIVPVDEVVGGGVAGPPRRILVKDGFARGQRVRVRARLIPGNALGTITTLEIIKSGNAFGSSKVKGSDLVRAHPYLIEGKAIGEKYVSEDEMLMIFAEAA